MARPVAPTVPMGCAALDHRALRDVDAVQMKVQRVQAEAVIEHDEPAREEEVADHRDPPAVGRHHGRAEPGRIVGARVRHARLAIDDAPGAEARPLPLACNGRREPTLPEPLGRRRSRRARGGAPPRPRPGARSRDRDPPCPWAGSTAPRGTGRRGARPRPSDPAARRPRRSRPRARRSCPPRSRDRCRRARPAPHRTGRRGAAGRRPRLRPRGRRAPPSRSPSRHRPVRARTASTGPRGRPPGPTRRR